MPPMIHSTRQSSGKQSALDIQDIEDPKQPSQSFWSLLALSLGFLGIQFGWSIQISQMGPLLESLGSNPTIMSFIFWAGPVTGVLVQPLIGAMSDQCTSRFGRRRPFLLAGALLTALSLFIMPNAPNLLIAATLLWLLDASLNITQGPYRALVPDVVPKKQHATAFTLMSLTIGLGSVLAFLIGYIIPSRTELFYLGGVAMLAAMIITILTTQEKPLSQNAKKASSEEQPTISKNLIQNTLQSIAAMPKEAQKLCIAHSITWFGLGCLFFYYSVFVPHTVFGASDPASSTYQEGVKWASLSYAVMNAVCFLASMALTRLSAQGISKKALHTVGLLSMATAMIAMFAIPTPTTMMIAMGLFGIGWASTLSLPFAMLSDYVPKGREGVLMGTFNVFIAAPQVLSATLVGNLITMMGGNFALAILIGGIAMLLSAISLQQVQTQTDYATLDS